MVQKTGIANLPLHYGQVPSWLADRMTKLGAVISQAIIHHYGRDEYLARLANPFWFQSFGAVMGMDWHSSGITTSVIGALKRGLNPRAGELGIRVCGGRGKQSRRTPAELAAGGEGAGFDGGALARAPAPAQAPAEPMLPRLSLPDHHDVRAGDVILRRLHGTLAAAAEAGPRDFAELLLVPGIGARTIRSLAMVAEVVHGAPAR